MNKDPYNQFGKIDYSTPLKRSLSGFEVEHILLDNKGYVAPRAKEVIAQAKKQYPTMGITKEAGKHMIEMQSYPTIKIKDAALSIVTNVQRAFEVAQKNDLTIYPYATYPGKFNPELEHNPYYNSVYDAIGRKDIDKIMPLMCGFHYHYTLPRGVFDHKKKFLKTLIKSKTKQSLIDSHNMLIAIDPALTTIMQSSPFVQGKYLAKCGRMLVWRGGKKLKYYGAFGNLQSLVGLQPYKQTITDLIQSIKNKDTIWKSRLQKAGYPQFIKKKKLLDCIWCPVKINKIGTLEQRGMDVNRPKNVIAVSVLTKFILRAIQREFLHVLPSDIGIDEPFKQEGNIIFVPPHSHVRNVLQYESAYNGFNSKEMYKYCARLTKLAKAFIPKDYKPLLRPITKMLSEKKTTSDTIIKHFKKAGYGKKDTIPKRIAAEIALKSSEKFLSGNDKLKSKLENL